MKFASPLFLRNYLGFHSFHPLSKIFPESAVLIILGLAAGYIIYEVFRLDLYLHPGKLFSDRNFLFVTFHFRPILSIPITAYRS